MISATESHQERGAPCDRIADGGLGHRWTDPQSAWWDDSGAVGTLDFGLAVTFGDFQAALRLMHDRYVWRRYIPSEPSGLRLSVHNLLPSTKVVVAKAESRVVGALMIVEDSRLGLPMDQAFGAELDQLRDRGRRVMEATSLAVDPTFGVSGAAIVLRLLRIATLYGARIAHADDLCFLLHPRHHDFYASLFPFRWFSERRPYRQVHGPMAFGVRIDLRLARALIRTEAAGLTARPATKFFFGPEGYSHVIARLHSDLPRSTLMPTEWARLFAMTSAPPVQGSAATEIAHAGDHASSAPDHSTLLSAVVATALNAHAGGLHDARAR